MNVKETESGLTQRTLLGLTNDVYSPTSMVMSAPASHSAFTASRQFTGHTG